MSLNDKITIGTQVDHGKVTQAIGMAGSVTQRVVDMSVKQFEEGVREALVNLGWTPPGGPPALPEILHEAHEYGQFGDDFDYPLAKPIRKALRDLIDAAPRQGFTSVRLPESGMSFRYMPKEVSEVVNEMKTRTVNGGRYTSPTLIAWANRIEAQFDRPPVESLGRDSLDELEVAHPDDQAVDRFALVMKAKLADARAKGRSGWEGSECSQALLSRMLHEHVVKGDPRDVANLCMMLFLRGETIQSCTPLRGEYHPATFILIQGLKKLGAEGAAVISAWDKARAKIDGGSYAASNLHAQQALLRCEEELCEMIKLAGDYDLDEQAVASLETAIESMMLRRVVNLHANVMQEAADILQTINSSGDYLMPINWREPIIDELRGMATMMRVKPEADRD